MLLVRRAVLYQPGRQRCATGAGQRITLKTSVGRLYLLALEHLDLQDLMADQL